jgi:predicted nucleic acid-binding protein
VTSVFLDTVGLIAVWDRADQWHAAAEQTFSELRRNLRPMVTTTFVLSECGNAAARRPYRNRVCRLREILESAGDLIIPDDADWNAAWGAYERGDAGKAGIVDLLSFAVMRRLGLTEAFTNDRHFQAAGFVTLF